MDIQITTKKSEGVERLLEVSVPLATVLAEEEKQARRYATSVRLPGFRPGKAPAAMVPASCRVSRSSASPSVPT